MDRYNQCYSQKLCPVYPIDSFVHADKGTKKSVKKQIIFGDLQKNNYLCIMNPKALMLWQNGMKNI
jgi:hypothetical protein